MRILFISDFLPSLHADSAGVLDAAYLLKDLAKENQVILICNYCKSDEPYINEVRDICDKAYFIRNRTFENKIFYMVKTFFSLFTKLPAIILMTTSNRFKLQLKTILDKEIFDIIIFEFTQSMIFLDIINKDIRKIVDESDIAFIRRQRFIENNFKGLLKKIMLYDNRKLQTFEINYLNRFDGIMLRTKKDKELLKKYGVKKSNNNQHIFLPWVDFNGSDKIKNDFYNEKILMFYGAMWRPVNNEAVLYFVEKIFPYIIQEIPIVKFYIVGSRPSKQVKSLSSDNIIITGFVDSVEEYYSKSKVVVAPLISGSGIKGKVIQALGFSRPIVTTSIGAEGIEDRYKNTFFIRDDPKEFAESVISLLINDFDIKEIELMKVDIQNKYNWNNNFNRTHNFIKALSK